MKFKVEFHGVDRFRDVFNSRELRRIEKRLIMKLLFYIKQGAKANIKGELKRRTGTLMKSVKYRSLRGDAGMLYIGGKGFYGRFYEAGTRQINAKPGKMLHFDAGDGYRTVASVPAIRPRWFLRKAVFEGLGGKYSQQMDMMLQRIINEMERVNGL